eukprot:11237725-Karenia_brevis.AAC.1
MGDKEPNRLLGDLPKHAWIKNNAKDMWHNNKLTELEGGRTTHNMFTHVRVSRIATTTACATPNRNVR